MIEVEIKKKYESGVYNNMTKEEEKVIDKILDQLDNNTKNMLIRLLMTNDRENIWIQVVPIYEDLMHQGHVILRYIKDYKYCVGVKHDAASYVDSLKGNEPYMVTLELDEDEI